MDTYIKAFNQSFKGGGIIDMYLYTFSANFSRKETFILAFAMVLGCVRNVHISMRKTFSNFKI